MFRRSAKKYSYVKQYHNQLIEIHFDKFFDEKLDYIDQNRGSERGCV